MSLTQTHTSQVCTVYFFFSSRRRHTRFDCDWSSDVCSSDLQSESLTGKVPFARTWMHTGLVRYNGKKMSKSLGNLVLVGQALERAPAAAVRLYMTSHRYGRDWEFRWSGLNQAARLVERVRALVEGEVRGAGAPKPGMVAGAGPRFDLPRRFAAGPNHHLDTPKAVRQLRAAVPPPRAAAGRQMLPIPGRRGSPRHPLT